MKTNVKKSDVVDVKKLQANDKVEEIDTEALITEAQKKVDDLKAQLSEAKQELRKLTGQSNKEPKGPGVIATILTLVTDSGKTGITKQEILDKLVEMFPDRSSEGMSKTINVQLPTRMSKEKKVNIVKENDRFLIK